MAANEALDRRKEIYGAHRFESASAALKSCVALIDATCTGNNTAVIPEVIGGSRLYRVNWKAICTHLRRDNKDLVKLAWSYDLSPPTEEIFPNYLMEQLGQHCGLPSKM